MSNELKMAYSLSVDNEQMTLADVLAESIKLKPNYGYKLESLIATVQTYEICPTCGDSDCKPNLGCETGDGA